ncbi:MAG: arginine N-succinyltransferase [Planctomycetota bacterium]
MFLFRQPQLDDADMLFKLARTSHFVNLPPAKDIIEEKIVHSRQSFRALASEQRRTHRRPKAAFTGPLYMFCVEDTETGHCLGVSMVIARMGGPGHPNVSFRVDKREFFSEELHIGSSTQVLELDLDESGPTEVGGLILSPAFRRHPARVGKQLSLLRFHFIGIHRSMFAGRLLAEMMAPIDADGNSPFWEYVGRRFINLTYEEAYRFSQRSRDFMFELMPREPLYVSLLPPEARRVIGAVGPDTVPARRLLEALGFAANGCVDIFDGGPHLDVKTDDVPLVKDSALVEYAGTIAASKAKSSGFVSHLTTDGDFRALHTPFTRSAGKVRVPKAAAEALVLETGDLVGVTGCSLSSPSGAAASRSRSGGGRKVSKPTTSRTKNTAPARRRS